MKFQLRSDETAMENLYRAARISTADLYIKRGLRVPDDEKDDLFDSIILETMRYFLSRLHRKMYRRDICFFYNVRYCCVAVFQRVSETFFNQVKERLNCLSLDRGRDPTDEDLQLSNIIPEEAMSRMRNYKPLYPERAIDDPNLFKNDTRYTKAIEKEYREYCTECVLMGVTPASYERFCENRDYHPQDYDEAKLARLRANNALYKERKKKRMAEYQRFLDDPEYEGTEGRKKRPET